MTPPVETLSGEARLRQKRRKFFTYIGLAMVAAFAAGLGSGAAGAFVERGILPVWLLWAVWALVVAAFAWFTRDYFRKVDELDLLDNLWASTVGLYTYVVAFGTWYFFADLGLLGPMNHMAIFALTLGAAVLAYVARKLGWR